MCGADVCSMIWTVIEVEATAPPPASPVDSWPCRICRVDDAKCEGSTLTPETVRLAVVWMV